MLPALHGRAHTLHQYIFEGLVLLKLRVVLDNEVLEVVLSEVDVLMSVLHVFRKTVHQTIKHNGRLLIKLADLLVLLVDKGHSQLRGPCVIKFSDDLHALLEKRLLFRLNFLEDLDASGRVNKLRRVHFI